jgi:hypothetical protein
LLREKSGVDGFADLGDGEEGTGVEVGDDLRKR